MESSLPVSILVGNDVTGKLFTAERIQLDWFRSDANSTWLDTDGEIA